MSFVRLLLIIVCAPVAALLAWVFVWWLAMGVWKLGRAAGKRADPPGWPMVLSIIAALFALIASVFIFPNEAQLSHFKDKLIRYPSTRIELALQHDDPVARSALVETLRDFMQRSGRTIRYSVRGRYSNYVLKEEVPSYYRFLNGQMEIAAGDVIQGDLLAVARFGFAALALFPSKDTIPEDVRATVHVGGERIAAELLPRTTQFKMDEGTAWSRQWGSGIEGACYIEVQALFSSDAFNILRAGYAVGEVELATGTVLRDTRYVLTGLKLVRGSRGRMVKELETDRTRIYGVVRMRPSDLLLQRKDCGTVLLRMADPALMAAGMLAQFPMLDGLIAAASVHESRMFSPWYGQHWQAVTPMSRQRLSNMSAPGSLVEALPWPRSDQEK